jgi:hypothetical protein
VDHLDGILNHRRTPELVAAIDSTKPAVSRMRLIRSPSTAERLPARVIFATRSVDSLFHRPLTVFAW